MSLSTGQRLGPYEILAPIGAGGMGEVYRARDTRLGREVAIKVLPAELSADGDRLKRFEKEARAASSLNHPNIVTIYEVGSGDSTSFIVMELVEGKTLGEMLAGGPLQARRTARHRHTDRRRTGEGALRRHRPSGLEARERHGDGGRAGEDSGFRIGEADVQPELEGLQATHAPTVSEGTRPGVVMGTVSYMSPEQASGHSVDFRSDQFSFGSILYEMATGKKAFRRATAAQTMAAIIQDEPEPIAGLNPKLPAPLRWIIEQCLTKEPRGRYAATDDLARDLARVRAHISEVSGSGEIASLPGRKTRLTWFIVAAAAALLALSAGVFTLGRRTAEKPMPTFHGLTFRRGLGGHARFASDGQTIVYGAAWEGGPMRLYSTRADSPESRLFDLPPADILGISSSGEMAVLLNPNVAGPANHTGTLARVPIAGGAPREILEDVQGADWSPDGKELAVVRKIGERRRLEYPIGKPLYEAEMIFSPRVSPRGDLVAFYEEQPGVKHLCTVDRSGRKKILASNVGWFTLAWSSSGDEIWYYGPDGVVAVSLSGRKRTLARFPHFAFASLEDIARDGRALVLLSDWRRGIVALPPGETRERELSWFGSSWATAISRDGSQLLFEDGTETITGVYLRKTDGSSPPVRLAEDAGGVDLSPDLKWALIGHGRDSELELVPTGAGSSKVLKLGGIDTVGPVGGCFFPDGKRILIEGRQPGRPYRCYVQDIEGGPPRPVTPEGVHSQVLSPDGRFLAVLDPDRKILLYPLEGGAPKTAPGPPEPGELGMWSADGRSLYVMEKQEGAVKVFRRDLATSRREPWKEIAPADPAGILSLSLTIAPDGGSYVYSYARSLSTLYLVQGLR